MVLENFIEPKCKLWVWLSNTKWILVTSVGVTHDVEATEQYLNVALVIFLYKVGLTFMSAEKTLLRDHSKESY